MFGKAAREAGKRVVIVVFAATVAIAIWSFLDSSTAHPFYESFKEKLFIGGVAIMAIGGAVGIGLSEVALYNSQAFKISRGYVHTVNEDRPERRRQQFVFMLYCAVAGVSLMVLPFALP